MGFATPILINNDAAHLFGEDDGSLSKKIYNALSEAGPYNGPVTVGHKGYCNYVEVLEPKHMSTPRVLVMSEGCLTDMDIYSKSFQDLKQRNPEYVQRMIDVAKRIIKECEK